MRDLIIKFFALDYIVPIFGKKIVFTRGANVIFPLMVLSGVIALEEVSYPYGCIVYTMLFISLYFGFVYFRLYPLKQEDYVKLDRIQKYVWDTYNFRPTTEIKEFNSPICFLWNGFVILCFICWYLFLK